MENVDLKNLSENRTFIEDVFKKKIRSVELAGWVHNIRDLSKVRFIILKDMTGMIQIAGVKGKTSEGVFSEMDKISRESVIVVKGSVVDSKQAPGGKEINPEEIIVLNSADELPIDIPFNSGEDSKTELPKRLDYRFLDLHRKKTQAIFKVQATLMQGFREYMVSRKGVEANFPSIISSSSEGGTELFKAKYFEKDVYLSQSCQLYKQMLACSMERVFTIFTVWRAEKHNTVRHLNESRQFDFEMAFADEFVVMDELAKCVQHMVGMVIEKNQSDLELLGIKLKVPTVKYMTFAETNELLEKEGIKTDAHDLTGIGEKKLGELFPDTIVFVHDWPLKGKPFYIMPKGKDLSCGFDAIYKGMEITSGGQRVHLPELLKERLKVKDLDPKDFKSYIDSFRYGAPPHAGWGMGVERLTMVLLELSNIREAVMFPRDRDRLTP
ncbi:MAG: aspartate--tRNA(Asn) ligase [Nanoarchaeota archaeon]|nr:aspartate--tRNA(Asn) ligase [Nanoarchaeota archaeon]